MNPVELPNGYFEYDEESVYSRLNKGVKRRIYLYVSVSTITQKKDLENQIDLLKHYCVSNGIQIHGIFRDIASGISFEKCKEFFQLLNEIIEKKGKRSYLFQQYGTKMVVISEIGNPKLDFEEIFDEIIRMLHSYSLKLSSKRKNPLILQLISETKNGDES